MDRPTVKQHPHNLDDWVLQADFPYGDVTVPRGFVTDFASIPRPFWSIISPTELGTGGPVGHDWEYRNGIGTRKRADVKFLAYMKRDGISAWKRTVAYNLVRVWGWRSWNSGKVQILTLPDAAAPLSLPTPPPAV